MTGGVDGSDRGTRAGLREDNAELLALLRAFQPRSKKRDNVRAAEEMVRQDGLPTIHSSVSGSGKFHACSTARRWRGWTAWAKGAPQAVQVALDNDCGFAHHYKVFNPSR